MMQAPFGAFGTNDTVVPVGTIVAFKGFITDIPKPWVLCDGTGGTPDLSDSFIISANATFAYNTNGGAATALISGDSGSGGEHSFTPMPSDPTSIGPVIGSSPGGTHAHALSGTLDTIPESFSFVFIMATSPSPIPVNAVLWLKDTAANIPNGVVEEYDLHGRFAKGVANSARGFIGANNEDTIVDFASAGHHYHDSGGKTAGRGANSSSHSEAIGSGAHFDSVVKSFTKELPPYYALTAIRAVGNIGRIPYLVASYFGDVEDLPAGWVLCDGASDTPDLAGRMILGADGVAYNVGDFGGSAVRAATTDDVTHAMSHQHGGSASSSGGESCQHETYAWSHTHAIPSQVLGMPPWHALHHIMTAI